MRKAIILIVAATLQANAADFSPIIEAFDPLLKKYPKGSDIERVRIVDSERKHDWGNRRVEIYWDTRSNLSDPSYTPDNFLEGISGACVLSISAPVVETTDYSNSGVLGAKLSGENAISRQKTCEIKYTANLGTEGLSERNLEIILSYPHPFRRMNPHACASGGCYFLDRELGALHNLTDYTVRLASIGPFMQKKENSSQKAIDAACAKAIDLLEGHRCK